MPAEFSFVQEEYSSLRKEIELTLDGLKEHQRNCVIATALAYAWLATRTLQPEKTAYVAWGVPLIVPICGFVRDQAMGKHLRVIADYVQTIEAAFRPNGIVGCEHYHALKSPGAPARAARTFWITLVVVGAGPGDRGSVGERQRRQDQLDV
jgi:hypothetical protein